MGLGLVIGLPVNVDDKGAPYYSAGAQFAQCLNSLAPPMGYSTKTHMVSGKRIDHARNEIVEVALRDKAEHVLFLDSDVLFPPHSFQTLLLRQRNNPEHKIISGVYWSKSNPTFPLVFVEEGRGSLLDWRIGDYIKTWGIGMGLVLIHTDVFRAMEPPWFEIDYGLTVNKETGGISSSSMTEDLPFCDKAGKLGFEIWVDTGIQAGHYDRDHGVTFGLNESFPQAQRRHPDNDQLYIGDILAGGEDCRVLSPNLNTMPTWVGPPDVIPEGEYKSIKVKDANIEHMKINEVTQRWSDHVKPGGTLEVMLPDYVEMIQNGVPLQGTNAYKPEVQELAMQLAGLSDVVRTKDKEWYVIKGRKPVDKKPLVSIIIPAHGLNDLTAQCLASLREKTKTEISYEVIVVDNGSEEPYPPMGDKLIRLEKNLPFGAAVEEGMRKADGIYLLLLNNDTIIIQDTWLDNLLHRIRGHGNVAAVGPKQLQPNGTIYHAGIGFTEDRIPFHEFAGFSHDHATVQREKECLALNFGCVLLRKELLEEYPFDPRFGDIGNYEDIDWCLRIREIGLAMVYTPSSEIIHLGAVTQAQLPDRGRGAVETNRAKFQEKWKEAKPELFGQEPSAVPADTGSPGQDEVQPEDEAQKEE